jgi:hypothetical protein
VTVRAVLASAVLGAALLGAAPSLAQDPAADKQASMKRLAGLATLIDEAESDIASREWQYRTLLGLVLLVGILGVGSAAMQKFEGAGARLCTLAMGVVISIVTVVTNTLFPDDYRTLKRNVDRARQERRLAKVAAGSADLSASPEVLRELEREVQDRYVKLYEYLGSHAKTAAAPIGPASAWAQTPGGGRSEECARWPSRGALCFSGIGRSSYPDQARQNALSVAVEQASRQVARQMGGRRPPEWYREYVERYARVEEIYPSRELRTGSEFAYVAILTLDPRFVDARVLATTVVEPRTISPGDFVLIHGASGETWLRIDGQSVRADRGPDGASTWVFGKREGARGALQEGDLVSLRGRTGDPYVTVERDGRLAAFRGPSEATLFRIDKRGGSDGELIREGDAFALVEPRTGRVVSADRAGVGLAPPGDSPTTRLVSVIVPRLGDARKY